MDLSTVASFNTFSLTQSPLQSFIKYAALSCALNIIEAFASQLNGLSDPMISALIQEPIPESNNNLFRKISGFFSNSKIPIGAPTRETALDNLQKKIKDILPTAMKALLTQL